jgi:hypothetical protein
MKIAEAETQAPKIDHDLLAKLIVQNQLNMHQDAMWSYDDIALYFRKSKSYAQQHIVVQDDFPRAVNVAVYARCKVWRAGSVMAWAKKKQGQ